MCEGPLVEILIRFISGAGRNNQLGPQNRRRAPINSPFTLFAHHAGSRRDDPVAKDKNSA
jgi:hypothetical protein